MSNLTAGFLQGFGNVMLQKQQQAREDEMRKLQKKFMNAKLEVMQKQMAGKEDMMDLLTRGLLSDQQGPGQAQSGGLAEVLGQPQGQRAFLQSGGSIADLLSATTGNEIKSLQAAKLQADIQHKQFQNNMLQNVTDQFFGGSPANQTADTRVSPQQQMNPDDLSLLQRGLPQNVQGPPTADRSDVFADFQQRMADQQQQQPTLPQQPTGMFDKSKIDPYSVVNFATGKGGLKPVNLERSQIYNPETGATDSIFMHPQTFEVVKRVAGKPRVLTTADAGRRALNALARNNIQTARNLLKDISKDKTELFSVLTQMTAPKSMRFGKPLLLSQLLDPSAIAKTLIQSGVTSREDEIKLEIGNYVPNVKDFFIPGNVERKLNDMEKFLFLVSDLGSLPTDQQLKENEIFSAIKGFEQNEQGETIESIPDQFKKDMGEGYEELWPFLSPSEKEMYLK